MNTRLTAAHVAHLITLEQHGKTTAQAILADARQPASPLHDLYDWDLTRAAEAHWLDRTREIVRLVRCVVHTDTITVKIPRYVRDPDVPAKMQGYATVDTLRVDPNASRRALIAEFERVTSALARARLLARGLDLELEVDALLARIVGVRALVEARLTDTQPSSAATPAAAA